MKKKLKGLLGPKKELWDLLQRIEKLDAEAADITASVRDLPTVRTAVGRARAWLRLALMQVNYKYIIVQTQKRKIPLIFFIFFNPSLTPSFSFPKILAWISSFPYLMVLTSFFRRNFLTTFDFLWDSRTCWRSFMSLLPWWGVMRLTWSPRC